jgi:hypothetical protein
MVALEGVLCVRIFPQNETLDSLKVHKIENVFGSDFEFCTISLLLLLKY